MFKSIPIYIKVYFNKVEIVRLDTRENVKANARENFSNSRMIVSDFINFEACLRENISKVVPKQIFSPTLKILIQVKEELEGGLSSVEKRTLLDSCEHSGAKEVYIHEGINDLTIGEALNIMDHV